jgi:hypothetical protein
VRLFRYHPAARDELRAAARLAETERPGRGASLQLEVLNVERRIRRLPRSAPPWPRRIGSTEVRKARVRRFPFLIIYALLGDRVVVIAIAHTSRKPGYWRGRLGELGEDR